MSDVRHQASSILKVQNLSVRYVPAPAPAALENVSFSLEPGTITGLIGVNGAGKSTLFNAIMGLGPRGQVSQDITTPSTSTIAYVPQHHHVDWTFPLSVRDVVSSGTANGSSLRDWACWNWLRPNRVAEKAMEQTQLTELADRQIGQLSGGQKKRAFVARAIAQGAEIILLDEPFAGVDDTSRRALITLLHDLAASGTTLLVSTHDLARLPELCEEAILLNRTVIAHGPVSRVLSADNLRHAFTTGASNYLSDTTKNGTPAEHIEAIGA